MSLRQTLLIADSDRHARSFAERAGMGEAVGGAHVYLTIDEAVAALEEPDIRAGG